jgi:hypothetical protein
MVSHVDNDHIVGVKKLFRELKQDIVRKSVTALPPFGVRRLWLNTFNDVLGDAHDQYYKALTATLASHSGQGINPVLVEKLTEAMKGRHPDDASATGHATDIALVLAGHSDGRELRDTFKFLHEHKEIATLNAPFLKNGRPALITQECAAQSISGLTFRIAGPMEQEIQSLQKDFDEFIQKKGLAEASLLAAYSDTSITNVSSIVCLLEMGGRRILLTGDVRGDKILDVPEH